MRQSDRIGPIRLSFRRRLTAGVAIGALLPSLLAPMIAPRPAYGFVDPVTVSAVASIAGTALSFMNQGPDLTLEVVQQNHRLLLNVHERLDGIEEAMGGLLKEMARLPGVQRKITQKELDAKSSNELINSLSTLTKSYKDDGQITGCEPGKLRGECYLVYEALARMRELSNSLRGRDPVVHAMALALAPYYELAFMEATGDFNAAQLDAVRNEHREVLQGILDLDNPNGLPAVIADYEQYRAAVAGDEVARRSRKDGDQLPNVLAALSIDELPRLGKAVPWFSIRVIVRYQRHVPRTCYSELCRGMECISAAPGAGLGHGPIGIWNDGSAAILKIAGPRHAYDC